MRWIAVVLALGMASCGPITEQPAGEDEVLGKLDKAGAKATKVELKVTIAKEAIDAALGILALEKKKAERRWITFYDTPDLALYARGLLLRSREVAGDDDDTTVKVRPLEASKVASAWFSVKKFKCEIDRTSSKSVSSCSLTKDVEAGEIDEVACGQRTVKKLFDDDQELFASSYGGAEPEWSALRVLGPTDAWVWELVSPSGLELTVELWEQGSLRILEASTKEVASKADAVEKQLLADLDLLGLKPSPAGETKTKSVLTYLAAQAAAD